MREFIHVLDAAAMAVDILAPEFTNHNCEANTFVSPFTGVATSGGGAPLRPVSHRAGNTDTFETPLVFARTEISANPGTTRGGRIITRTG